MQGSDAWIDPELCNGCGDCIYHCPRGAIYRVWYTGTGDTVPPSGIVLSPNPSAGYVRVAGVGEGLAMEVYDMTGRLMVSVPSAGSVTEVDLAGFEPGLYMLVVGGEPELTFTVLR
jgi:ferredoxin